MGRRQRMRMARKRTEPAPPPKLSPELASKAAEVGAPELAQPLAPLNQQPVRVFVSEVEQRCNTPEKGDIVQVVVKPNEWLARIGIVHEVKRDGTLVCYAPGRKGFPHQFKLDGASVEVVGRAKIKYNKDTLPEESPYSDAAAALDKI